MPETRAPVRPNFLRRLRNPIIGAGIGGVALTLVLTGQESVAPNKSETTTAEQLIPNYRQLIEPNTNVPMTQTPKKHGELPTTRSKKRAELPEQCWDGDISDLNHVTEAREKKALANIAIACEIITDEKWYKAQPTEEINCLVEMWDRESGWSEKSVNSSSGAGGIPQAMPKSKMRSAGKDWETNPATQIKWGIVYINDRYKTPCNALKFWDAHQWY